MATLTQLRTLVTAIVQDTSFTSTIIDGYLNDGVNEIAAGMESSLGSFVTPPLPNLLTIDTIDTVTTAAYVSMPDEFGRDLRFVSSSLGVEIDIANSFIEFSESYPLMDTSGLVVEVIEYGGNLYYQGIPTAMEVLGTDDLNYTCIKDHTAAAADKPITGANYETYWSQIGSAGGTWAVDTAYTKAAPLTIHYFRLPVDMEDDDDTPDGIPTQFQKKLLVNYACKEIFSLIEDGIEGQQVNTAKHTGFFLSALRDLELSIPADGRSLILGADA